MYKKIKTRHFRLLFTSNILFILSLSVPTIPYWGSISGFILATCTSFLILKDDKSAKTIYTIGTLNLIIYILGFVIDYSTTTPLSILKSIPLILLYIIASLLIFKKIINERPVTEELLYGLGAVYLQTALTFAFIFDFLEQISPGSFSGSPPTFGIDIFVYFSIITLTTVGYGDISPSTPIARIFVCAEVLFGILFTALIVAKTMSLLNVEKKDN
ncbi:two pore domain potassium channel family protein [Pseudomonas chlororaphis]|uniref:potassium channel family protein n=2 Tax=Pseudomonas chlororaphis TaxID=587753 RepID=UPI001B33CD07|nr:potassium channel family protein [Pseudomonas chlororaphis]MBP5078654.1 two pore domain potassium channel family protein [Pseudomonas chlororaphis]